MFSTTKGYGSLKDTGLWKKLVFCVVICLMPIVLLGSEPESEPIPEKSERQLSRHYLVSAPEGIEQLTFERLNKTENPTGLKKHDILAQAPIIPEKTFPSIHDSVRGITIAELQHLAEVNNPTLKLLKQKVNATKGEWIQVGLKPNPVLAYEAEEVGDGGKAGKHGFVLEQEIITGGKRKLDRHVGAWACDVGRQQWTLQWQAIQNEVKVRAYEVLASQKKVEIRKRLVEISRQSVEAVVELGKAGEVSKIDLLQIRAKANESKAALQAAKSEELIAWKKLSCMVGVQELSQEPITDSLENIGTDWNREVLWSLLQEQAPQLIVARLKVQQARTVLAKEQAGAVPDVTISGGVHYDYGERQTLASFGVGVPLKLYDRNQGNTMKARAELAAACRELDRQVLVLYEEFSETFAVLESSKERVLLYRDTILPDVQESLDLSLKGYRQGEYNYMDVLSAQQSYLESQTQYVDILKDYAISSVYLEGYMARDGLKVEFE